MLSSNPIRSQATVNSTSEQAARESAAIVFQQAWRKRIARLAKAELNATTALEEFSASFAALNDSNLSLSLPEVDIDKIAQKANTLYTRLTQFQQANLSHSSILSTSSAQKNSTPSQNSSVSVWNKAGIEIDALADAAKNLYQRLAVNEQSSSIMSSAHMSASYSASVSDSHSRSLLRASAMPIEEIDQLVDATQALYQRLQEFHAKKNQIAGASDSSTLHTSASHASDASITRWNSAVKNLFQQLSNLQETKLSALSKSSSVPATLDESAFQHSADSMATTLPASAFLGVSRLPGVDDLEESRLIPQNPLSVSELERSLSVSELERSRAPDSGNVKPIPKHYLVYAGNLKTIMTYGETEYQIELKHLTAIRDVYASPANEHTPLLQQNRPHIFNERRQGHGVYDGALLAGWRYYVFSENNTVIKKGNKLYFNRNAAQGSVLLTPKTGEIYITEKSLPGSVAKFFFDQWGWHIKQRTVWATGAVAGTMTGIASVIGIAAALLATGIIKWGNGSPIPVNGTTTGSSNLTTGDIFPTTLTAQATAGISSTFASLTTGGIPDRTTAAHASTTAYIAASTAAASVTTDAMSSSQIATTMHHALQTSMMTAAYLATTSPGLTATTATQNFITMAVSTSYLMSTGVPLSTTTTEAITTTLEATTAYLKSTGLLSTRAATGLTTALSTLTTGSETSNHPALTTALASATTELIRSTSGGKASTGAYLTSSGIVITAAATTAVIENCQSVINPPNNPTNASEWSGIIRLYGETCHTTRAIVFSNALYNTDPSQTLYRQLNDIIYSVAEQDPMLLNIWNNMTDYSYSTFMNAYLTKFPADRPDFLNTQLSKKVAGFFSRETADIEINGFRFNKTLLKELQAMCPDRTENFNVDDAMRIIRYYCQQFTSEQLAEKNTHEIRVLLQYLHPGLYQELKKYIQQTGDGGLIKSWPEAPYETYRLSDAIKSLEQRYQADVRRYGKRRNQRLY